MVVTASLGVEVILVSVSLEAVYVMYHSNLETVFSFE